MTIAYGTYGMPYEALELALPRLAQIGYDAVELCIADDYPAAAAHLSLAGRKGLRRLLGDNRLDACALMMLSNVMADAAEHERNLRALGEACLLAHDLAMNAPVLTTTVGGRPENWETDRTVLVHHLRDWAAIAGREGCIVAIEPHVGSILDRPERAAWAIAEVASLDLRLNLDVSHFDLQGYSTKYVVALLAPLAVHAHVKDGRTANGKAQFLLPGAGGFDYAPYLQWMRQAGYEGPITVEISRQLSTCADYDPYTAARFSYQTLASAFARAGIRRRGPTKEHGPAAR